MFSYMCIYVFSCMCVHWCFPFDIEQKGLQHAVCHAQMRVCECLCLCISNDVSTQTPENINNDKELLMKISTHRTTIFPVLVTMALPDCMRLRYGFPYFLSLSVSFFILNGRLDRFQRPFFPKSMDLFRLWVCIGVLCMCACLLYARDFPFILFPLWFCAFIASHIWNVYKVGLVDFE